MKDDIKVLNDEAKENGISESDDETPEEVSFTKSKEAFLEESNAIRFELAYIDFLMLQKVLYTSCQARSESKIIYQIDLTNNF